MKRTHRRLHALIWIILFPLLLVTVYWADVQRLAPAPATPEPVDASTAGVLP